MVFFFFFGNGTSDEPRAAHCRMVKTAKLYVQYGVFCSRSRYGDGFRKVMKNSSVDLLGDGYRKIMKLNLVDLKLATGSV